MHVRWKSFACAVVRLVLAAVIAIISIPNQPSGGQQTEFTQPPRLVLKWKWGINSATPGLLNRPWSVVVDGSGNIFIADTYNDRIQKFDAQGKFLRSWGEHGVNPGQFFSPQAVALDQNGNVLVSDTLNNRIQRFTPEGVYLSTITSPIGFYYHRQMIVDANGTMYVADTSNYRIQKFHANGEFITSWNDGSDCGYLAPGGMALDDQGNLLVANASCNQIDKYSPDGNFLSSWPAGPCCDATSQLSGLAVDAGGRILAVDELHHLIRIFSNSGILLGSFGEYGSDPGQFNRPAGISIGPGGIIYIADNENNRLQVFDAAGKYLWMIASDCQDCLNSPDGIATNSQGKVYVADSANNRILVFNKNGKYQEKIGSVGHTPGKFYFPNANDLEFDTCDNLYVADSWNDRIQKFSTQGQVVKIWQPAGGYNIAVDHSGAVYLAEQNNLIEKFSPSGERLLAWGSEGSLPGQFDIPLAIETDLEGNVWVGDWFNRRVQKFDSQGHFLLQWSPPNAAASNFIASDIAIDPMGRINILDSFQRRILVIDSAGHYVTEWSLEQLTNGGMGVPEGITYDRWGNLYITDYQNGQVFRFQLRPFNLKVTELVGNPMTGETTGMLSANASGNTDPYNYSLVDGPGGEDNPLFTIQGNQVKRTGALLGSENPVYSLRIRVTNSWGDTLEQAVHVSSFIGKLFYLPLLSNSGS